MRKDTLRQQNLSLLPFLCDLAQKGFDPSQVNTYQILSLTPQTTRASALTTLLEEVNEKISYSVYIAA